MPRLGISSLTCPVASKPPGFFAFAKDLIADQPSDGPLCRDPQVIGTPDLPLLGKPARVVKTEQRCRGAACFDGKGSRSRPTDFTDKTASARLPAPGPFGMRCGHEADAERDHRGRARRCSRQGIRGGRSEDTAWCRPYHRMRYAPSCPDEAQPLPILDGSRFLLSSGGIGGKPGNLYHPGGMGTSRLGRTMTSWRERK